MSRRAMRLTAGLLCSVLATACSSSESSQSRSSTAPSPPAASTSTAGTSTVPMTTSDATVRLLAGTPMDQCTVASQPVAGGTSAALCGTLEVPEDRSDPTGRQIGLRVAVIPAQADSRSLMPFFALAGGPGDAGTAFFGWLPGLFADVHASRDIVLVDQRGTGGSNALVLPPMPDTTGLSKARRRRPSADVVGRMVGLDRRRSRASTRAASPPTISTRSGRRSATSRSTSTVPPTVARSRSTTSASTPTTSGWR